MKFKKFFVLVACMAMLVTSALPAFAGMLGEDYGEIPMAATAPVVDGQMDSVYSKGLYFPVDYLRPGDYDTALYAECWVVWNGDYLYAYCKVEDPDIVLPDSSRTKKAWEYDSVEFFIDYSGTGSYATGSGVTSPNLIQVVQYRVDASGYQTAYGYLEEEQDEAWASYGTTAADVGSQANPNELYAGDIFEFGFVSTADAYTAEFKLPLSNVAIIPWGEHTLEVGDAFAISVQVNDEYTGRKAEGLSLYRVPGLDDSAWQAQYYPNVVLSDTVVEGDVEEPTEPDEPTDPVEPNEPTDPVDPVEPTDPVDPVEPDDPEVPDLPGLDPVEPTDPVDPVEPTEPTDPVDPVDPTEPTDPVDPVDPTEPTDPVDPVDPTEPTDPVDPMEPTDPVDPAPEDPEDPAEPDEPTEPDEPSNLGTPAIIGIVVAVVAVIAVVVIVISKKK